MKNIAINVDGELVCPNCASKSFSNRRTRAAKLVGGVTVGVGALAAPKRMQCLGCREYLKSPPIPLPGVRVGETVGTAILTITPSAPFGAWTTLDVACTKAKIAFDPAIKAQLKTALKAKESVTLPELPMSQALALKERLDKTFIVAIETPADGLDDEDFEEDDVTRAPAAPGPDLVEQLTKLAGLRDQGILTEEEFAAQKAKLLG